LHDPATNRFIDVASDTAWSMQFKQVAFLAQLKSIALIQTMSLACRGE
jgi:hypothetical protein